MMIILVITLIIVTLIVMRLMIGMMLIIIVISNKDSNAKVLVIPINSNDCNDGNENTSSNDVDNHIE